MLLKGNQINGCFSFCWGDRNDIPTAGRFKRDDDLSAIDKVPPTPGVPGVWPAKE